jgi:two-component system phosphate regulon sensor histidine kinase PhoR
MFAGWGIKLKIKNSLFLKFFAIFSVTIFIILASLFFVLRVYIEDQDIKIFEQNLSQRTQTLIPFIKPLAKNNQALKQSIQEISKNLGNRITVIDVDGTVIADSQNDEKTMSSHLDRPEIKAVIGGAEFGLDIRNSTTNLERTLYYALPMETDAKLVGILRLSVPINALKTFSQDVLKNILIAFFIAIILSTVFAYAVSRKTTKDIAVLLETISEISKGNFKAKAKINSNSELAQFAEALNKMSDDIENLFWQTKALDELKRDFISNASHELKTPVTAIVGFSQMLQTKKLTSTQKHYVEIIQKQSKRLSNIVTDLLSLNVLENTGLKDIKKTDVPIDNILDDIINLYQKRLNDKNIVIKQEISPDAKTVYANEFYLEQALTNLIDNAVKYTEEGSITITTQMSDDGFVEIAVSDTGIGIEEKYLSRLFERFYVVDKSRSRESGGTGLGLAIVKHIALIHNARIDVRSKICAGSSFKLHFPPKNS